MINSIVRISALPRSNKMILADQGITEMGISGHYAYYGA